MVESHSITEIMHSIGARAKAAYCQLAMASAQTKHAALMHAAQEIRAQLAEILSANATDMQAARAKNLSGAMLDRLALDETRIEAIASGLEAIAALPDPIGHILEEWEGANQNGLQIQRVSIPLGVIGIIYESRPNVTADAGGLCIKSGNAAILRSGSESFHSSRALVACLHSALEAHGLPRDAIQLVPTTDRAAVGEMLSMTDHIDIIIPRGGKSLTERIAKESRIPTIQHLDGNCHSYIHTSANHAMAIEVITNAKMRRTGICGATESVVIDAAIAPAILPALTDSLTRAGCAIRGDDVAQSIDARITAADESDWEKEYLDAIISVKIVEDSEEAIAHINRYSSHHTDAILAEDNAVIARFTQLVDSAIVMVNSSTQFADGGEFSMGAEIGISTGRLHARGPVGAAQLTTYKYVVHSEGSIRSA